MNDLYLSYSGRKSYLDCPMQYKHKYVLHTDVIRDKRDSLLGQMIGKVFEWFYSKQTWNTSKPIDATSDLIKPAIGYVLDHEKFNCSDDPELISNIESEMIKLVPLGVKTIYNNNLLADSYSELKLDTNCVNGDMKLRVGGRADFVHYHSRENFWILDGKGSKYRDKYVDPDQLIYYSALHFLKHSVAPSRIGFIYWRFPDDPIDWVDYNEQSVRDNLNKTFDVAKRIKANLFDTKPSSNCRICDYKSECSEGETYLSEHKIQNCMKIEESIFDLDYM